MGLTLTEKILKAHIVDGEFKKGTEIGIRIDQTLTQDATGTMAYLEFEAMGIPRVKTERSVAYIDHNTLQNGFENADDHRFIGSIAKKHGIYFSRPGNGICHQVHLERFGVPGKTLIGSDSHTPTGRLSVNREKANMMGVSTKDIAQTLQYGLSGQRMGYLYMNGKQYEIVGEINRQQRNDPGNLKAIYMRSADGQMIQMENLVDLMESIAPPKLYRYNRFVSATISAGLADGKTIGEGLDEMDKIAKATLDDTFRTALAGDSKEFRESSSSLIFAFALALLLIYLILAAQFESFKDPFVIMLTVPLAVCGALIFMLVGGQTMNIFSQIGIIMLIGLVAKNGILIVEFANQRQKAGEDKMTAIREASAQRLRPILMTSVSTILGLLPLMFATGEGCNGRIAMGTAVVGGMLISTLLTMFVVPAIYSFLSTNLSKKKA
ncbi:MAG: efflux RND transporter permease subunit [Bacteroidaceae bacterium]|nr:efflux RND transporter permease subunit [Bacteroidaceae bacterium]